MPWKAFWVFAANSISWQRADCLAPLLVSSKTCCKYVTCSTARDFLRLVKHVKQEVHLYWSLASISFLLNFSIAGTRYRHEEDFIPNDENYLYRSNSPCHRLDLLLLDLCDWIEIESTLSSTIAYAWKLDRCWQTLRRKCLQPSANLTRIHTRCPRYALWLKHLINPSQSTTLPCRCSVGHSVRYALFEKSREF